MTFFDECARGLRDAYPERFSTEVPRESPSDPRRFIQHADDDFFELVEEHGNAVSTKWHMFDSTWTERFYHKAADGTYRVIKAGA